jgi:beta-glucuronidase
MLSLPRPVKLGITVGFFSVWVNGLPVGNHVGGHLPFEMDISTYLDFSQSNTLTVAVNNTLTR